MTPSAFSPSTSARQILVGVIETPSTSATRPSNTFARRIQLSAGRRPREASMGWRRGGLTPALLSNLLVHSCPHAQSGKIDSIARQSLCWRRNATSELRFDEGKDLVGGGKAAE